MATYEDEHRVSAALGTRGSRPARQDPRDAIANFMDVAPTGSSGASDRMGGRHPHTSAGNEDAQADLIEHLAALLLSHGGGGLVGTLLAEARDHQRDGNPPTSASVISTLPERICGADGSDCPICTDSLANVRAMELPCRHRFHRDCVVPWLRARNTCPLCRHELPTDDEDYERIRRKKKAEQLRRSLPADSDDDDDRNGMYS